MKLAAVFLLKSIYYTYFLILDFLFWLFNELLVTVFVIMDKHIAINCG